MSEENPTQVLHKSSKAAKILDLKEEGTKKLY
jgi:hypothetical protein